MAAYLGSRFQPALAVLPRGEEVERRAAAAPGLAAPARAANDDSVAGLPAAHAVGIELDLYLLLRRRIARGDLDRLLEHRRDPERVDRAHRIRLVPSLETNAMCAVGRPENGYGTAISNSRSRWARSSRANVSSARAASSPSRPPASRVSALLGRPPVAKRRRIQK